MVEKMKLVLQVQLVFQDSTQPHCLLNKQLVTKAVRLLSYPFDSQTFLTVDSMGRLLRCDHLLESHLAILYCGAVYFSFVPHFGEFGYFDLGTVRS